MWFFVPSTFLDFGVAHTHLTKGIEKLFFLLKRLNTLRTEHKRRKEQQQQRIYNENESKCWEIAGTMLIIITIVVQGLVSADRSLLVFFLNKTYSTHIHTHLLWVLSLHYSSSCDASSLLMLPCWSFRRAACATEQTSSAQDEWLSCPFLCCSRAAK